MNTVYNDILPDNITISEMHEYGYTWEEMLPLSKDKALDLYEKNLPLYKLYEDDSEALIENDKEQIELHDGLFGIEKDDWQRYIKTLHPETVSS